MMPGPKGVALHLLILTLALLASSTLSPPVAAVGGTWVVDDDSENCLDGTIPDFPNITAALMAGTHGDTIRVCEGEYTEQTLVINVSLTITGPGATPANDGVATVHHGGGLSALVDIKADGVTIEGLDLDLTPPPSYGSATLGIDSAGDFVTIQDNEIHNGTGSWAVLSNGSNVNILRNNIHDMEGGLACNCDDSGLWSNTVDAGGGTALRLQGDRGTVAGNVVTNGVVLGLGDDLLVNNNQISAGTSIGSIGVAGNSVTVTNNSLSDSTFRGSWWSL